MSNAAKETIRGELDGRFVLTMAELLATDFDVEGAEPIKVENTYSLLTGESYTVDFAQAA